MSRIFVGVLGAMASTQVFAQSTATQIEEGTISEIVVEAKRLPGGGLIQAETAPKSRSTVTEEYLRTQLAGQSVVQSLNLVPGVNFTNSDAYGASGGNLRMRSFDGNRISLMLDGIQLNDTGNYAMYTNQLLDPEIVDRVTVNLGTTDIDSPTASATGGTINILTVRPQHEAGGQFTIGSGSDDYQRYFLRGDTGAFGPWATEAFLTASYQNYDKFRGPGELERKQINGRIFQDLGDGDFITLAIHGNRNRNNQYRTNLTMAQILASDYKLEQDATCTRVAAEAGTAQADNLCSNYYNVRINPSDTANIRGQSRFGLTDSLTLTVDPAFQYTLANGGGYTSISETDRRLRGASAEAGVDLNGDDDVLDSVGLFTPNNTNTRRYSVNSSLLWEINDDTLLRLSYTYDFGKHRQTGQFGYLEANGDPENVFAGRNGRSVKTADGVDLRGRDRYTEATLNQVSFGYSGKFADDKVSLSAGARAPFFERELHQYCYTNLSGGSQYCTTQAPNAANADGNVTFTGVSGTYKPPYEGTKKYDELLPNVGVSFEPWDSNTFYLTYAKGFSAPRTDNLYNAQILDVLPETTDSFDLGYRHEGEKLLAQAAVWKVNYDNRIVSSYDSELGYSVDRNVGEVKL